MAQEKGPKKPWPGGQNECPDCGSENTKPQSDEKASWRECMDCGRKGQYQLHELI